MKADVEPVLGEIIKGITTAPVQRDETGGREVRRAECETFKGAHTYDAWEKMNEAFMERGWGDGFPLVAPTPEKVEAALMAVSKGPLEVLGHLVPGNALVTVEKLAINSVMAGCKPEHLPVLVTAVESMLRPPSRYFPFAQSLMSTGPHFFILLVNGPVVKSWASTAGGACWARGNPGG